MQRLSDNTKTSAREGNQSSEFETALQILDDFDVIEVKSSFFGFFSLKSPQEIGNQLFFGQEIIKQFKLKLNEYEKISFDDSEVNVHALRTAIHRNLESLRAISISNCRFYLSDEDVKTKFNQITFLRMFSEVNLVWLIKSLKFVNLESIKIKLPKDLPEVESLKKQQSLRVFPIESNALDTKNFSSHQKELIKEFQCEEECSFLLYEESKRNQDSKYSTEEQLNALQEQLIWDNVQDKHNFFNKLYDEILSDIEQQLQVYKKFTKFAFNGIKLLIIGQALNIPMALEQLQNLIHINYLKIQGIIFKDTGHIQVAAFTDLLNQLLVIPQLSSIGFLQSVLDEASIPEFNFLIQEKQVRYLVLYQSFFLDHELKLLLKSSEPIKVNHHRFFILDIQAQKEYEFCPYTFAIDETLKKSEVELFEIEKVFKLQRYYSKLIQEEINFYVGRNLSILTSTITDSIMFKYSQYDDLTDFQYNEAKQQELDTLIDQILKENQISILNIQIIIKLIDSVRNQTEKNKFVNILKSCKSFKCYFSDLPRINSGDNYFSLGKFLILHSNLRGLSRLKKLSQKQFMSLNYSQIIDFRKNQKHYENFLEDDRKILLYQALNKLETRQQQSDLVEVIQLVGQLKIPSLNWKFGSNKNNYYFTQLVNQLKNLQKLNIQLGSDEQIKGVDLAGISETLEILEVIGNDEIKDLSFISEVFRKCPHLKELKLDIENSQLSKSINFEYLSNSLQSLSLIGFRKLSESTLNEIFNKVLQLKRLKLEQIEFESDSSQRILFPKSITRIQIKDIQGLTMTDLLIQFGKIEECMLEDLEMTDNSQEIEKKSLSFLTPFLNPGSLSGLSQIKKLSIVSNLKDPEFLKMILINTLVIEEIEIDSLLISSFNGSWLEERAISLRRIKFYNQSSMIDFESLRRVFQKAKALEYIQWRRTQIKPDDFIQSHLYIPNQILTIILEDIFFQNPTPIYNLFFQKCQQLRKFRHYSYEKCELIAKELNFQKISSSLYSIRLKISITNTLDSVTFINQILQQCKEIQVLDIPFVTEENILEIDFSQSGKKLQQINFSKRCQGILQKWILVRNSNLFCIQDFEQNCLSRLNGSDINFYEIIENPSIHSIISQTSQQIDSSLKKIINELLTKKQQTEKNEYSKKQKIQNPFYFDTLLRQFKSIFRKDQLALSQNIFLSDDVFSDPHFYLNQLIFYSSNYYKYRLLKKEISPFKLEQIQQKDQNLQKEIIEKETKCLEDQLIILKFNDKLNLECIKYILNNCKNLKVLDFSYACFDSFVKDITLTKMESVTKVSFKCTTISSIQQQNFVQMIIEICPNMKKLNFSRTNQFEMNQFNFQKISENLEKINISNNSFLIEEQLSQIFKQCLKLQVLKFDTLMKNISLKVFSIIPCSLLKISMKYSSLSSEIINEIVKRCQLLTILDFSQSYLVEENQDNVSFEDISTHLNSISLFRFKDSFDQSKIVKQILLKCQLLKTIKLYQGKYEQKTEDLFNQSNLVEEIIIESSLESPLIVSNIIKNSSCLKKIQLNDVNGKINMELNNFPIKLEELSIKSGAKENLEVILNLVSIENIRNCIICEQTINPKIMNKIINFQDLKIFNLENCSIEIELSLFNELFKQANDLEIFSFSNNKIMNNSFERINFNLTPPSLKKFSIDGTVLKNYFFISDMLSATSNSLNYLSLCKCQLDCDKFSQIQFQNAGNQLVEIYIYGNPYLKSLNPLQKFFEKGTDFRLKAFIFQIIEFEQAEFLAKYSSQIDIIQEEWIEFGQKTETTNFLLYMNVIELIKFINDPKVISPIQKVWRSSNKKRQILKYIINNWLENPSFSYKKQMEIYYLFLFMQGKMKPKIISITNSKFFILSPESLFNSVAYLNDTKNIIVKEFSNSLKDEINKDTNQQMNSFYFGLIGFDILSKNNFKYIFGYNKQQFSADFPTFYDQSLTNQGTELDFINMIYNSIRKDGVQRAFLPISIDITEETLKEKRMNELEALILINTIPPSSISLQGMSIQFVKSWYAINFSSPLSVSTTIKINYELLENSSISNFLSLKAFKFYIINYNPNSITQKIKKLVGLISYSFFKMFSAPAQQYRFDHTIIHLENYIRSFYDKGLHHLLTALYLTQLFVCVFSVWFFQLEQNVGCGEQMQIQTYIMYGIFGVITFCVEAVIFSKCLKFVTHLIPDIQPNCRVNFPNPIINRIKQSIIEIKWINRWYINYLLSFINSQLSRLDFLTNIGYLYSTYTCGDDILFLITLLSLLIVNLANITIFIQNLIVQEKKKAMITHHIDQLYQVSSLLNFQSVAVLLDLISPTNSIIIFNKMFNQRIIQSLNRNIFQDIPLILLKTIFLLRHKQEESSSIYPIISSGLMFISSLTQFLSVTPSIIGQGDFNKLCEFKKQTVLPKYLKNLEEYEQYMINSNLYEEMKCIKSETYRRKVTKATSQSIEDKEYEDDQKDIFESLRRITPNIETLNKIFGNSIIVNDSHSQSPLNSPHTQQESAEHLSKKYKGVHDNEENNAFLEGSEIKLQKTLSFQINLNLNNEKKD